MYIYNTKKPLQEEIKNAVDLFFTDTLPNCQTEDEERQTLYDLIFMFASENFKAGNKAGIRWKTTLTKHN